MVSTISIGDSSKLLQGIETGSVDCVITDPPYDLMPAIQQYFHSEFLRIARGDVLVFCRPELSWPVPPTRWLYWVKQPSTKNYSKSYGRFVEAIALYKRSDYWDQTLYWGNYTGVWSDTLEGERVHEHQKPLSLMERLVKIHCPPGGTVLDPFCGSGATIVAADQAGRVGLGIELREGVVQDYGSDRGEDGTATTAAEKEA